MTLVQWCLVYNKINNESDMWNAVYLTYMYNQIVVSKLKFLIAIQKGTGQYCWKMNWFLFIDHNVIERWKTSKTLPVARVIFLILSYIFIGIFQFARPGSSVHRWKLKVAIVSDKIYKTLGGLYIFSAMSVLFYTNESPKKASIVFMKLTSFEIYFPSLFPYHWNTLYRR